MAEKGMRQEPLLATPVSYPGVQQPPPHDPYRTVQGYAAQPPPQVTYTGQPQHDDQCRCSAGWWMFGLGFFLPIGWIIGLFVPCCTEDRQDYRAQKACIIAIIVSVAVAVLFNVLGFGISMGGGFGDDD
ncbi:hypothetical protein BSKO_07132 [Bryopsis sp. KO-2023]|nr:hypothetical protein BSKO_07132 [Bryopsis sp. KO-2023]